MGDRGETTSETVMRLNGECKSLREDLDQMKMLYKLLESDAKACPRIKEEMGSLKCLGAIGPKGAK